jgi:tRNA modification GTPase
VSMGFENDTIAAIATPSGEGGIAVVRISGSRAKEILLALFAPAKKDCEWEHSRLYYGRVLVSGKPLDEGLAVMMYAPKSYTREDVAEVQLHGGAYLARAVVSEACALGARPAEAGEFTRRAFENGRIDLSQAEGVMNLIHASGEESARAAMRQLEGAPSAFIKKQLAKLYGITAGIEALIDYPEEIAEDEAAGGICESLAQVAEALENADRERDWRLMTEGLNAVLCGKPNVGKSSLMNALLQADRSIVTAKAGTTRDTIESRLSISGQAITLIDTAGLRSGEDEAEVEGVSRAKKAMEGADALLIVIDASQSLSSEDEETLKFKTGAERLVILNKSDLTSVISEDDIRLLAPDAEIASVSAKEGLNIDRVKAFLLSAARHRSEFELSGLKQMKAARAAAEALRSAIAAINSGMPIDLAEIDIRSAVSMLGELTGDEVDERILDRVFAEFCVGK